MVDALACLKKHWGYDAFRDAQAVAVDSVLNGFDTLAVLPTGYGKSAIFQILALITPGCAIVVTPLIALMKDQVDDCLKRGIPAGFINSHVDQSDIETKFSELRRGKYKLFYMSPERLDSPRFLESLADTKVSYIVVDECHCHPAGTLIETPTGKVRIEWLRPGHWVCAWDGEKVVPRRLTAAVRKQVGCRRLLRIALGDGGVNLTSDHPVFVKGRGYVAAEEVGAGDEVLAMRATVLGQGGQAGDEVLQPEMLIGSAADPTDEEVSGVLESVSALVGAAAGLPGVCEGASRQSLSGAHADGQSYGVGGDPGQGSEYPAAHRASSAGAGRQRASASGSAATVAELVSRRRGRVRGGALADRRGLRGSQGGGGVRRAESYQQSRAGARCPEGRRVVFARVDRVEVLEPADHEFDRSSGRDHREVFALTVEKNQNYFAGGVLTHNCASRWGHDFRPAYMKIGKVFPIIAAKSGRPPVLAVTATATSEIESDICKSLTMKADYQRTVGDPVRPNLTYGVIHAESNGRAGSGIIAIRDLMPNIRPDGRYVFYVGTHKFCDMVKSEILAYHGNPDRKVDFTGKVGIYHAGLSKGDREKMQNGFKDSSVPIIVATTAFGMGIDVPNIRMVVHVGIPGSVEDYCQEAGRAGRDGLPSDVVLIHDNYGVSLRQRFIDGSNPPYKLFLVVWRWFQECTSPDETVMYTVKEMCKVIVTDLDMDPYLLKDPDQFERQIGGVLAALDAYKLLERDYSDEGTSVVLFWDILKDRLASGAAPFDSEARVKIGTFLTTYFSPDSIDKATKLKKTNGNLDVDGNIPVMLRIDVLAGYIGASIPATRNQLRKIVEGGCLFLGEAFRGKTSRLLNEFRGKKLEDIVSEASVDAKRKRDQARLDAMIAYANSHAQKDFIRNYFLKG